MGSVLKSTSRAANVAGEKQQRAAIASATNPKRLRKIDETTAKPLSNLRANRPMHRNTASPEHSLSPWNLKSLPSGLQQKSCVRSYDANFLQVNPFRPRISPMPIPSSSKITASRLQSTSFQHQLPTIDVRRAAEHFKLSILRQKNMDGECGAGMKKPEKRP